MATLLSAQDIVNALDRLPEWSGGVEGLVRSVQLSDEQHLSAQHQVMQRADAMNHHPDIERSGGQTRFTLSTHSAGGVTALDLALAAEVDDVVNHVRSGGEG
ncbi:MAG: 4a-hydroxytetrahydrobiopterin dehydratase [Mycobacteriales bacterium]